MKFMNWGEIPYQESLEKQLSLVQHLGQEPEASDHFIFCTHPPVVTLGRSSQSTDLIGWQGETVEVSRGGRATYHGPNQLLLYPIIKLSQEGRQRLKPRDVHAYLRSLENILVESMKAFGLDAEARQVEVSQGEGEKPLSLTGVWVGERKLASIGVAVKKWVTYHGAALNVERDSRAFQGIRPCGFRQDIMVSMEELLGETPDRRELMSQIETWSKHFLS